MEFWTNLVISLAAIISINITMYLYQNVCNACGLIRSKSIDHHSSFTQKSSTLKAVTLTYVHISSTCMLNLKKSKLSNFYFTKKPLLLTFHRSTMNCQFSYQCNKAPFWVSKGIFFFKSHLSSKRMLAECYIKTCPLSNMHCSCIYMWYRDICIQTYWLAIAG